MIAFRSRSRPGQVRGERGSKIATAAGLEVRRDDRLRERMNWAGAEPIEDFLADWARCVRDRDFVPRFGDSSRQAALRLHAFVQEQVDARGPVAAVTHGVTADLLRTLVGDDRAPASVVHYGVPSCAVTILKRFERGRHRLHGSSLIASWTTLCNELSAGPQPW
jgi:broad specificity phosphatase PhoE